MVGTDPNHDVSRGLMEPSGEREHDEKIQLGKVFLGEYVRLLERRISESRNLSESKKFWIDIYRVRLREIERVLPEVENGNFYLVVQPSGLIALEIQGQELRSFENNRIGPHSPNTDWDREFLETVKNAVAGSEYATKVFERSEMNRKQGATGLDIGKPLW